MDFPSDKFTDKKVGKKKKKTEATKRRGLWDLVGAGFAPVSLPLVQEPRHKSPALIAPVYYL